MAMRNEDSEDSLSLTSEKVAFIGRCDHLEADDLHAFDDSSRTVGYPTFSRKVGASVLRAINACYGVPIKKDYQVSYATGRWKGKPAVCMFHSAWHHIWTLKP